MKISASFLSIKEDIKNNIQKLDKTNIDYLHVDVMDGIFVPNKTRSVLEFNDILKNTMKGKDVHLMVQDVKTYVDAFTDLNPTFITFHYEVKDNIKELIKYIKDKNIKVGLSIKPETKVEDIYSYLPLIDMILIMSVEPGKGGQEFLTSSIDKVNKLVEYRQNHGLNYLIEIDGGINNVTLQLVKNVDIAVVGSYITNNDYEKSVNELKS